MLIIIIFKFTTYIYIKKIFIYRILYDEILEFAASGGKFKKSINKTNKVTSI